MTMYNAWICYTYYEDEEDDEPIIEFTEPYRYKYNKVIPIVFSVLKDWKHEK